MQRTSSAQLPRTSSAQLQRTSSAPVMTWEEMLKKAGPAALAAPPLVRSGSMPLHPYGMKPPGTTVTDGNGNGTEPPLAPTAQPRTSPR